MDSPLTKSKLRLWDNHITIMDFYLKLKNILKKKLCNVVVSSTLKVLCHNNY
jgi:hypothetical protein